MGVEFADPAGPVRGGSIRRIQAEGGRWRVLVETYAATGGFVGRFVFEPEDPERRREPRQSGPALRGETPEEVLASAHDVTDDRLRELLHSLA